MNLNAVSLAGRVAPTPTLTYRADGTPVLKLVLRIVEENAKLAKTFTLGVPVEVQGTQAEALAARLEPDDTLIIAGKLAYRTMGEGKAGGSLLVYAYQAQPLSEATAAASSAREPR